MQQWRKKVSGTLVTLLHPNIVYFQAIILAAYNLQWILKCPLWKWKLQVFSVFISQYPRKTFFFLWKSKTIVLMIQTRWKFFSVRASTIGQNSYWVHKPLTGTLSGPLLKALSITAQRIVGMTEWALHKTAHQSKCSGRKGRQVHNFLFHRSTETADSQNWELRH